MAASKVRRPRRRLSCEKLETRRLLVAEGAAYTIDTELDTAGLVGDISAQVSWGDGTTSDANVTGATGAGDLKIRFDFSLDSTGFFSGANASRQTLLQIAADSIVNRLSDQLTAVVPPPDNFTTVRPNIFHPSQGSPGSQNGTLFDLPVNPTVAANEIVVYAGARDLPSNVRAVGGGGGVDTDTYSCTSSADCNQKSDYIDNVVGRGQVGALLNTPTDIAPLFGSISFDNDTNWYFGNDPSAIAAGEVDFITVATHELAHVLGFGASLSWNGLVSGNIFTGAKANAAYVGSGGLPVEPGHWAAAVGAAQPTVMGTSIQTGTRQYVSALDLAALDDIGWDVVDTTVTVEAEHRYGDDGTYAVAVTLNGSTSGQITTTLASANVTNVAPSLTLVENQTVVVGQELSLVDLGRLTDPGFRSPGADPPASETFTYTINWGDGSAIDQGIATIDIHGDGTATGRLTEASFDGTHTFQSAGTKTVTVRVVDDDGGAAEQTFQVTANSMPTLILELSQASIDEDAGAGATTLTVRRSGPATGTDQIITLSSDDTSEATLPASVVIPGTATSVTVPVDAVDDALLDGDQTILLAATAPGLDTDDIDLIVRDRESITASVSAATINENAPGSVNLVVRRSNTDTATALDVNVGGGDRSELDLDTIVTIPAGTQQVSVPLMPVDDDDPERTLTLHYTFTAVGYQAGHLTIDLLDDEPPLFQNPVSRYDVNQSNSITALDALNVINELTRRGNAVDLDPDTDLAGDFYYDVNGDYRISALDALLVINELARQATASGEGESDLSVTQIDTLDDRRDRPTNSLSGY